MTRRRPAAALGQDGLGAPANLSGVVLLLGALAVVGAATLLVIWVVVEGDSALVYLAMGLAIVSMILLGVAKRAGRRPDPTPEGVARPRGLGPESTRSDAHIGEAEPHRSEPAHPTAPSVPRQPADPSLVFPIGDYDSLWVSQIVPLLAGLDREQLTAVEERERGGRHRTAILGAIEAALPTAADQAPSTPVDAARSEDPDVSAGGLEPADDGREGLWDDGLRDEVDADGAMPPSPTPGDMIEPEPDAGDPLWTQAVVAADTVGATAAPGDLWLAEDREPFDWTGAAVPPADTTPDAGADPELWADEEPAPDMVGPLEQEGWDWTGDIARPPVPHDEAVESVVDEARPVDEPVPSSAASATAGSPRVRTFLGRRRSPVTVRRR